ncbi:MAG: helix-turn-helix domain-containing protein [Planctomycetota bacterium]
MADELLDAREAMHLLGINENELQTLVARGDLRAFRSAGTMKFRRDDISALKSDKGTEPTIIIPASGSRKGSGILPTTSAGVQSRPPSRVGTAVTPPSQQENATDEIVLDDIELVPTDDTGHTQQITVQQFAATSNLGSQTVLEPTHATVVESNEQPTGAVTAIGVAGSGRRQAPPQAPAIAASPKLSRVQAAAPGVSMATSRRTQAIYQVKTAGPVWTAIMVVTAVMFTLSTAIAGVMMLKGHYDKNSGERVIPPFLNDQSHFAVYRWCYKNTAGDPQDKKPESEYGSEKNPLRSE